MRQDDQQERLLPGSAALITMSQPFQLWQSSAQGLAMTIPRYQLASRLDSGLGRVIRDLVTGLFVERDALTPQHFNAVSDRLTELLCLLAVGDRQPKDEPVLTELADTIRQYVQAHAADPELCGQSIARALGWSLRQVQRALQCVQTTPRDLIRAERLRLGRDRLRDPAYRQVAITELAAQLGFSSASAFSTAFRREFGVRPREARRG